MFSNHPIAIQIIWYKDGKIVERSQEGHIIYSNDDSLLITPVSLADEGRYYCVARNLMGQRKSDTAIISVYGKLKHFLILFYFVLRNSLLLFHKIVEFVGLMIGWRKFVGVNMMPTINQNTMMTFRNFLNGC